MPTLVVVLGKAILDGQDGYVVAVDGLAVDFQHRIAVENLLGMIAPEQVHADAVGHIKLGPVSQFEL